MPVSSAAEKPTVCSARRICAEVPYGSEEGLQSLQSDRVGGRRGVVVEPAHVVETRVRDGLPGKTFCIDAADDPAHGADQRSTGMRPDECDVVVASSRAGLCRRRAARTSLTRACRTTATKNSPAAQSRAGVFSDEA